MYDIFHFLGPAKNSHFLQTLYNDIRQKLVDLEANLILLPLH